MAGRTLIADGKSFFKSATTLKRLIVINIAIFLTLHIVFLFYWLITKESVVTDQVLYLLASSNLKAMLYKPWTVFTYMFMHIDFMHIFGNMLFLYFLGRIFQNFLGDGKVLATYILGGLAGWFLYMVFYNVFPVFAVENARAYPILGASASVMAIVVAAATYVPNFEVRLFGMWAVKLKWIALFYVALDIVSIDKGNPGGHLAHLGGAIFGFFAIRQHIQGRSIFKWWDRMEGGIRAVFGRKRKQPKMRIERSPAPRPSSAGRKEKPSRSAAASNEVYNVDKRDMQKKVDEILDKISRSGYESLSKAEKEFLFKYSNRNN
jgi:membrane associated rhomboid family serine protease